MLGSGVLEVEPLSDLPGRLVERVVHLLAVDLAHDVERRVAGHGSSKVRRDGFGQMIGLRY